jgi:hypothetical protein
LEPFRPAQRKYPFRLAKAPKRGGGPALLGLYQAEEKRFDFEGESGSTVCFCLRYENGKGEAGPFGPMLSAVIP